LDEIYNTLDRALPYSFDARAYGWVTPARHQQSCGSCAAFATGGAMLMALGPGSHLEVEGRSGLERMSGHLLFLFQIMFVSLFIVMSKKIAIKYGGACLTRALCSEVA